MKKPLTDWEIGQELVFIQDTMLERVSDLPRTHAARKLVYRMAAKLGDYFDEQHNGKSHGFGLYNSRVAKMNGDL